MNTGYIYCITNESIPNRCKVGRTGSKVEIRSKQLFTTGVPLPFKIEYSIKVNDMKLAENIIHRKIAKLFVRDKSREWFNCLPGDIKYIFDNYKEPKNILQNNIEHNKIDININTMRECNLCNYSTNDRSNYYHHKQTKKHQKKIINEKNQNIELINNLKEKNNFLEKQLDTLNKDMEIDKLKTINKLLQDKITNITINNTNNINISSTINYVK